MHAVKALGAPRWIELPRCLFILTVMIFLIRAETVEIYDIFTNPTSPLWLKAHAVLCALAPV